MGDSSQKTRIYILLGPTAAGKSAVALDLAERAGAEIISIDSMQVYRGMDIGTAKPSAADRARVPHHLVDLCEPWESFSTAEYVRLAAAAVTDITGRGRIPLFVGGTALYVKSLILGIFEGPSADWRFRGNLRREAAAGGAEALHKRLAEVDPEAARRIHPNDLRRIERALEIYHKTGSRPSDLRRQWAESRPRYDARLVGLRLPRALLLERIDKRIDAMIAAGWLAEVAGLLSNERALSREASQALGYTELAKVVSGEETLEEAVAQIKRRTHRFAKAQMTWFKAFPGVFWVDVGLDGETCSLLDRIVAAFGLSGGR